MSEILSVGRLSCSGVLASTAAVASNPARLDAASSHLLRRSEAEEIHVLHFSVLLSFLSFFKPLFFVACLLSVFSPYSLLAG